MNTLTFSSQAAQLSGLMLKLMIGEDYREKAKTINPLADVLIVDWIAACPEATPNMFNNTGWKYTDQARADNEMAVRAKMAELGHAIKPKGEDEFDDAKLLISVSVNGIMAVSCHYMHMGQAEAELFEKHHVLSKDCIWSVVIHENSMWTAHFSAMEHSDVILAESEYRELMQITGAFRQTLYTIDMGDHQIVFAYEGVDETLPQ